MPSMVSSIIEFVHAIFRFHVTSRYDNVVFNLIVCNMLLPQSFQFDYDNGVGSSVDRFAIDLYEADGSGDCGTYVTSICDKPSIGCKDSSEF